MNEICSTEQVSSDATCNTLLMNVGDALYTIGGKWKLRIIIALSNGYNRFNILQRSLNGISARVLSNELKDLELNGFVKRKVHAEALPVLVEYELTAYSSNLKNVVQALNEWGALHRAHIRESVKS